MNKQDLVALLQQIQENNPDNIMEIFFVRKPSAIRMHSFQPMVSAQVQRELLHMILPCAKDQLEKAELVVYNPVGVADGEMEYLHQEQVTQITDFLSSISADNLNKEMANLAIKQISFYCINLKLDDHPDGIQVRELTTGVYIALDQ